MAKSFRYYTTIEELKNHFTSQGFIIEETFWEQDKQRPSGFDVRDTAIEVSYDIIRRHPSNGELFTSAPGVIAVRDTAARIRGDMEMVDRSLRLYEQLRRKFGRPPRPAVRQPGPRSTLP